MLQFLVAVAVLIISTVIVIGCGNMLIDKDLSAPDFSCRTQQQCLVTRACSLRTES